MFAGNELSIQKTLTFYLNSKMRRDAEAGKVNIVNRIANAFSQYNFEMNFSENSDANIIGSAADAGYSMFFMEEPFHVRALSLRRAYYYPFWRIESTAQRWNWEVARTAFEPNQIDNAHAENFVRFWRKRLYGNDFLPVEIGGFVFVPLQGRLLNHRSFQACSPIKMLEATLIEEPGKAVHATLHPKENYSDAEMKALDALIENYPQLIVSSTDFRQLIGQCQYVVTQNSAIAFDGYFFEKAVVLFSKVDFHHIAADVHQLGITEAFSKVRKMRPEYSKYIYWFLQKMSINAGRNQAEDQILAIVRKRGWDL